MGVERQDVDAFLDAVASSVTSSASEVHLRAVISRAYYAALWSCRTYLEDDLSLEIPKHGTHQAILRELDAVLDAHRSVRALRELRSLLGALRDMRTKADYATHETVVSAEATAAVTKAKDFIRKIRSVSSSSSQRR